MIRILVVALVILTAGCGVRPSGVIPGAPAPRVRVQGTALYLVFDHKVTAVVRAGTADPLTLLANGPDDNERAQGFTTEIPPDAGPIQLTQSGVTLSSNVSALSTTAVNQIVCTVTNDPGVAAVTLVGRGQSRGPEHCQL